MRNLSKREQIIEWFIAPKPKMEGIIGIIIAGIIGVLVFSTSSGLGALLLMGAGGYTLFQYFKFDKAKKRYESRPSDQQLDLWIQEDFQELEKKALIKCGIDESELVREYELIDSLWGYHPSANRFLKIGNDNIIRSSCLEICILNFTENQLITYKCIYDLTTGTALNEGTDEYFYKDVVSMSTKVENLQMYLATLNQNIQLNDAETLSLHTSGGTSINVVIRSRTLSERLQIGGGTVPTTRAEKAISVVRKMLREKKSN
jgi:hypothetical protein